MDKKEETHIAIFNGKAIRRKLVDVREASGFSEHPENPKSKQGFLDKKWYFSVVDVVGALTDSEDPFAYWRKLKQRLLEEGNETVTNCHTLKMIAQDGTLLKMAGKMRSFAK